ncbi:dicarboxylate/amino acid:cation symporter [Gammaproteobacteria bacterium]|nr:dicarboxylate/amino acid:cation symporter [Gammaproteobacteria bacterium]
MKTYQKRALYIASILLPLISAAKLGPSWMNITLPLLATSITTVFIRILQLVSLPIVFLSITTTLLKQKALSEFKKFSLSIIKYTISTTLLASALAAILYHIIQPHMIDTVQSVSTQSQSFEYGHYLSNLIPNNFFAAFVEQNVIGVMLMAFGLGLASFSLTSESRAKLRETFDILYQIIFSATNYVLTFLPIVIWAFYADLVHQVETIQPALLQLSKYVMCIVSANLIHALVTLPIMLYLHRIEVKSLFIAMQPALSIAFWSKSSNAALPSAITCLSQSKHCKADVAKMSMPLCISINMNACAAFILITVHFVAQLNQVQFTLLDSFAWVFIATLAAIGNAGVPMGCYFLAGALLTSFGIPLDFLGIILPIYGLIDMLESAINVWSDACVSSCVSSTLKSVKRYDSTIVPIH